MLILNRRQYLRTHDVRVRLQNLSNAMLQSAASQPRISSTEMRVPAMTGLPNKMCGVEVMRAGLFMAIFY
jgi:uracil phosphoribosyltransferase